MVSAEDILIRIKAQDLTGGAFNKIKQSSAGLKTALGAGITAASTAMLSYSKNAVNSAMTAEKEWSRFGAAVNSNGGNWDAQSSKVKKWARIFSDSMGRSVADTREAMTNMMNYGLSVGDAQNSMKSVAGLAAATGKTEAEASQMVIGALNGRGTALAKATGLQIKDYKAADGTIDKQRLLADIYKKTGQAADSYANTTEAKMQRVTNSFNSIKTDFGKFLIDAITPLIPLVQSFATAISSLPGPLKTVGFAAIAGLGAIGIVSGPIMSVMGLMEQLGIKIPTLSEAFDKLKGSSKGAGDALEETVAKVDLPDNDKGSGKSNNSSSSNNKKKPSGDIDCPVSDDKKKQMENCGKKADDFSKTSKETGKKLDKTADSIEDVADTAGDMSQSSKKVKTAGKGMEGLEDIGGMVPAGAGAEAAAGGVEAEAASAGLTGLSAGITTMLVPLLTISAVVAIMIPIITAIVVEALVFVRIIAEVIKALNFDSINLDGAINGMKQIGEAMIQISIIMGLMVVASLLTVLYSVIGFFSGILNPIGVAVTNIKQAATELQKLNSVQLDANIVTVLNRIKVTLHALQVAFMAMTSVVGGVFIGAIMTLGGLFGTISSNIGVAVTELKSAVTKMAGFKDVNIDEGIAEKLKAIATSLTSLRDAMKALTDLNWDINMGNLINLGGVFGTVKTHLEAAKNDIVEAANTVNSFTGLPDINEENSNKLKKIADALTATADALNALQKINDVTGFDITDPLKNLVNDVKKAKSEIERAANEIKSLSGLPDIPDSVKEKLSKVGSAAATVTNTMKALNGVPKVESSTVVSNITQARYAISNSAKHLASLAGIPNVPEGIKEKLTHVGSTAATMTNTLKALRNVPEVESGTIVNKIAQARYAISNSATHLASLAGTANIPEGIGEKLSKIGSAATKVRSIASTLVGFPPVNPGISQNVKNGVTAIKDISRELNTLSGTGVVNIGGLLNNIRSAITRMKATLNAAKGSMRVQGVGIGQSISNGVHSGLSSLNSKIMTPMNTAMSHMRTAGSNGGRNAGNAVTNGFKVTLKLAEVMKTEMSYMKQAVDNGISAAVTAARNGGEDVVNAFKEGINTGSPGDIAWAMYDEMHYTLDFIESEGVLLARAANDVGKNIVRSFGTPQLNMGVNVPELPGQVKPATLNNVNQLANNNPTGGNNATYFILNFSKGAVPVDAKNMTTSEARGWVLSVLEGLTRGRPDV